MSASPDKTVRAWDAETGQQTKKMAEHDAFVNSCCPLRRGPPLLISGSDDCSAKVGLKQKTSTIWWGESAALCPTFRVACGGIRRGNHIW